MKSNSSIVIVALLVLVAAGLVYSFEYSWLADEVNCWFPGREDWTHLHGDTLSGRIHSNDALWIGQDPVFYDLVSTSADGFVEGPNYNPYFAVPPAFNAPPVLIPERAEELRERALQQGHFYGEPGYHYYARFGDGICKMWLWPRGTVMDSTDSWPIVLSHSGTCIFVDAPLRVQGIVSGRAFLGCSHDIGIEDNLRYVDANPNTGYTPYGSANLLVLVSEGAIKIRNTPANGRENSAGLGFNQQNPALTDVVITASLWALGGSLTFENQNDPDSGYVCDCSPDHRGTVWIYGSLAQRVTGHLDRSNNGGTGYWLYFRYDERLWNFDTIVEDRAWSEPDEINFGNVPVGTAAEDTFRITLRYSGHLGAVYASHPFTAERVEPFQGKTFIVPVRFTPTRTGSFFGYLTASAGTHFFQIPLRAYGVDSSQVTQSEIEVVAAPNPFNLSTTIRFTLPAPEAVRITLYDILGREAKRIELNPQEAGEHSVPLHASELASGVYFLQLQAGEQTVMQKILLVK